MLTLDPPPSIRGGSYAISACHAAYSQLESERLTVHECGAALQGDRQKALTLESNKLSQLALAQQPDNKQTKWRTTGVSVNMVVCGCNYRIPLAAEMAWVEPSPEEKQLMAEMRKTRDRISSQMGQYLLKGYKMLDKTCESCAVSDSMS